MAFWPVGRAAAWFNLLIMTSIPLYYMTEVSSFNMSYRTIICVLCLTILPGLTLSAWADQSQPVDDLKALRQKLRSIREPEQLRQELLKQGLAQETTDQPMGFLNEQGDVVLLSPEGLGIGCRG